MEVEFHSVHSIILGILIQTIYAHNLLEEVTERDEINS